MKPTRRGIAVAGVAILAFVLGANFGARALDAVVVPAIAIIAVAVVQVVLTDRPTVERSVPDPGFPGDSRTMGLHIDTSGIVSFTDRLGKGAGKRKRTENGAGNREDGAGIRPTTIERTVTGGQTVEYDVELVRRGAHGVGPLSVSVRDSLGLVTEQYRYTDFEPLVVYPEIRTLTSSTPFAAVTEAQERVERQEFDHLREYVPSDSLRNVHWKTSAKRQNDLFVVEYTHSGGAGVSIAAEATADRNGNSVDAMATATASIVTHLLDHDTRVSLAVPNGHLDHGRNEYRRAELLDLLARTRPGRVSTERVEAADIYILGERGQTTIEIDGRQLSFDELIGQKTSEESDSDSSSDSGFDSDTGSDGNSDRSVSV